MSGPVRLELGVCVCVCARACVCGREGNCKIKLKSFRSFEYHSRV